MEIFQNHQLIGFFDLSKGYYDEIAKEFAVDLQSHFEEISTTMIRGLAITLSLENISIVTTLPLGVKWVKEIIPSIAAKKNLFL